MAKFEEKNHKKMTEHKDGHKKAGHEHEGHKHKKGAAGEEEKEEEHRKAHKMGECGCKYF